MSDVRETLDRLIRDAGDDYASLSRLLGRNAAYVQQFIRRGVPKKLDEDDRRLLARHFRVEEAVLGGPAEVAVARVARTRGGGRLVAIPRLPIGASAGPGALGGDERAAGIVGLDIGLLRELTTSPDAVSAIRVTGDSMAPTLADGDDILVDRADAADRLRDGIYVLRFDDALNVKRIARSPEGGRFTVASDNAAYPSWPDCDPARIEIVGRVIWVGRRVS